MNVILIAVIVLGGIGLVAALILFLAAKKFAVHEDERIGRWLKCCLRPTVAAAASPAALVLPEPA